MTTYPNLDPELAPAANAFPDLHRIDLAAIRRMVDEQSTTSHAAFSYEGVKVREIEAPGLSDAPPVAIRMMTPENAKAPLPVMLAMHGGGFVLGHAQDFDYFCLPAVRELGIAVANVEYRHAPEHPYPSPLDDCYAALKHVYKHGAELGIDPARIAVGGSSAGGGLAAGLTLRARDEGDIPIVFQLLINPGLDDRQNTASARQFSEGPVLTRGFINLVWRSYLGPSYSGEGDLDVPAYAVPARATDLSGLPPAYILAMELDPVRDANIQYALRLLEAGVSVELHSHPGAFHGSVEMAPSTQSSVRAMRGMLDALRRGLRIEASPL